MMNYKNLPDLPHDNFFKLIFSSVNLLYFSSVAYLHGTQAHAHLRPLAISVSFTWRCFLQILTLLVFLSVHRKMMTNLWFSFTSRYWEDYGNDRLMTCKHEGHVTSKWRVESNCVASLCNPSALLSWSGRPCAPDGTVGRMAKPYLDSVNAGWLQSPHQLMLDIGMSEKKILRCHCKPLKFCGCW